MLFEVETLPEFLIVGYPIRTDNVRAQTDIAQAWQHIMRNNVLEKIPNRIDRDIFALYTDYEADHNGPYTYILGCRVSEAPSLADGLVLRKVPTQQYAHMRLKGRFPQRLQKGWTEIWNSKLPRTYATDFEQYGVRYDGSDHAELDVFVAIHEEER
jgi:predicted transcriptional regulator YdeE